MKISTQNPLKVLRERLLISRSELARKANLSVMTVHRIENGKPETLSARHEAKDSRNFRVQPMAE